MSDSPIACSLDDHQLQHRREGMLAQVSSLIQESTPLDSGYSFRFLADKSTLQLLLEMILLERKCCLFLNFNLRIEPNNGPAWLEITGPEGTKEFIENTLAFSTE